MKNNYIKRRL